MHFYMLLQMGKKQLKSILKMKFESPKNKRFLNAFDDLYFEKGKVESQPNIFSIFYEEKEKSPFLDCLRQQPNKAKIEKDPKPQRLIFNKLQFNQTVVTKRQISLCFTRRKNEELQLSFEIQGKKFKLITTSQRYNTSITNKKDLEQIQIQAKSAYKVEYTNQKHKKIYLQREIFQNIKIKCNYGSKNHDPNKIEIFFVFHHCNYRVIAPSTTSQMPIFTSAQDKPQFPLVDFDLPIDANVDWPIEDMLFCINRPSQLCLANNQNSVDQGLQNRPAQTTADEDHLPSLKEQYSFTEPTDQQLEETNGERQAIIKLPQKEKIKIIKRVFKILDSNVQKNPPCQKLKCLDLQCKVSFDNSSELQSHLQTCHPFAVQLGIKVDKKGQFSCSRRALNYVLVVGKLFPKAVRQAIRQLKKKSIH